MLSQNNGAREGEKIGQQFNYRLQTMVVSLVSLYQAQYNASKLKMHTHTHTHTH